MVPYKRKVNKPLNCFYCNRKSSTRYDGRMRHFLCHNCKATNYLDSAGAITDPPVAKTAVDSAPTQYAIPQTSSPPTSSTKVFCSKCLQNQHLFIFSLAQYYPEDTDDQEYAALEKGYYKFYRGLVRRYPQCCAECEPKVREQLEKAAYTAKTDHLRRLLDRSAEVRVITSKTTLNYCHVLGRWLWTASFLLQLSWHICLLHHAVGSQKRNEAGTSFAVFSVPIVGLVAGHLPYPDQLMKWSFFASLLSFWWNPRWVDTYKSNTKHLVGFANYYRYQVLILAVKAPVYFNVSLLHNTDESRVAAQITAHASMAVLMVYLYRIALKSIQIDHTPLWAPTTNSLAAGSASVAPIEPIDLHEDSNKSMADILDEILQEPTTVTQSQPDMSLSKLCAPEQFSPVPSLSQRKPSNASTSLISSNPFRNLPNCRQSSSGLGLGGLSISSSSSPQNQGGVQYASEMEWSPSQSKHRAFSTYKPDTWQFGETPIQERSGIFWAKVPPAPTNPAHRYFNPPNAPTIRNTPASQSTIAFQEGKRPKLHSSEANSPPTTVFADPTFRPSQPKDERDDLLEKFQTSFSLRAQSENSHGLAGCQHDKDMLMARVNRGGTFTLSQCFLYVMCGLCLAVLAGRAYAFLALRPA